MESGSDISEKTSSESEEMEEVEEGRDNTTNTNISDELVHMTEEGSYSVKEAAVESVIQDNNERDLRGKRDCETEEKKPAENKEVEEVIPLVIPAQALTDTLLSIEDNENELEEENLAFFGSRVEPFIIESSTVSQKETIIRQSEEPETKESKPFKPLIEVISSQDDERTQQAETTCDKKDDTEKAKKTVRFSSSDTVHHIDRQTREELFTDSTCWAVPSTKQDQQAAVGESLVIEDITATADNKKTAFIEGHSSNAEPTEEFKLSDVPLVSEDTIQRVDAALGGLQGKPANSLSAEERVWQLAASGGSTLDEDAVTLDPQTKARVKEGLQNANLLDKVSLKF